MQQSNPILIQVEARIGKIFLRTQSNMDPSL